MIQIQLQGNDKVVIALNNVTSPRVMRQVINAMAESYTDDVLDYVQAGRAFRTRAMRGGANSLASLEQSINWHPNSDNSATVYANAAHAPFVEFGTKPHTINARFRKALKIPVQGNGFIFRRFVRHPGSKPYPFFYADMDNRRARMQLRAIEVLRAEING
jgi:hypothetical protein